MDPEINDALATGARMARGESAHFRDRYAGDDAISQFVRGVRGFLEELDGGLCVEELRERLSP